MSNTDFYKPRGGAMPTQGRARHWELDQATTDPRTGRRPRLTLCELCHQHPRKMRGDHPAYRFCQPCLDEHGGTEGCRQASRTRKADLRSEASAVIGDSEAADIAAFYNNWPLRGTPAEHQARLDRHAARIAAMFEGRNMATIYDNNRQRIARGIYAA